MKNYKVLKRNRFEANNCFILPIRYSDRNLIMKWRNEQMYHLRQNELLTHDKQDKYFKEVINKLYDTDQPDQILFSYFYNNEFIGYGGIVHINWTDRNAEISFLINTDFENYDFELHWSNFLKLIEIVAFEELNFHKIYTYAFDIRPNLYRILESSNFKNEARLIDHCFFIDKYIDVIIHSKINE